MDREIIKKYSNDDITIVWQPSKCIHVGICVRGLPEVFHPQDRPWITMDKASTEELKAQVDACPSGALTYYNNDSNNDSSQKNETMKTETDIQVITNGPLIVKGPIAVTKDGKTIELPGPSTALCRCGASSMKPLCDGAHKKVGFEG